MNRSPRSKPESEEKTTVFSLFVVLGGLLWLYAKRLFSMNTLATLEKKQGQGSGERGVEDELLDHMLERNPHQLHVDDCNHPEPAKYLPDRARQEQFEIVIPRGADEPRR